RAVRVKHPSAKPGFTKRLIGMVIEHRNGRRTLVATHVTGVLARIGHFFPGPPPIHSTESEHGDRLPWHSRIQSPDNLRIRRCIRFIAHELAREPNWEDYMRGPESEEKGPPSVDRSMATGSSNEWTRQFPFNCGA